MNDGNAFALSDICPHRGVPLSKGRIVVEKTAGAEGEKVGQVECPYHGWRFGADGACLKIPSLVGTERTKASQYKARTYHIKEQDGLIWVFMASMRGAEPIGEPPKIDIPDATPRWHERQLFRCHVDHAVVGLMDPAHAPYVHDRWWWRAKPKVKDKWYVSTPRGFQMEKHPPSKAFYKVFGDVATTITFELPSTRVEHISGKILGRPASIVGLTTCTPIESELTRIDQIFFWPRWLNILKPFFNRFGPTFLDDDRNMVHLQSEGLKFNPTLSLVWDSDVPAMWYRDLKREWPEAAATGKELQIPKERTPLSWWS